MKVQIIGYLLFCIGAFGQAEPFKPGDFQKENPNYFRRNPFYFEGRVDWNLLKIDTPSDAWEFAQRGINRQDDLGDIAGALADYRTAIGMNNLQNGTCQLLTAANTPAAPADLANLTPAPCMFTVRLRLGYLIHKTDPLGAIALYREVLDIDPLRLGVHALIGETFVEVAASAQSKEEKQSAYQRAIESFNAELALSPVTPLSVQLTGDEANNANVHWELGHVYDELGDKENSLREYDLFLKASKWHSNPYPWRIEIAKKKVAK